MSSGSQLVMKFKPRITFSSFSLHPPRSPILPRSEGADTSWRLSKMFAWHRARRQVCAARLGAKTTPVFHEDDQEQISRRFRPVKTTLQLLDLRVISGVACHCSGLYRVCCSFLKGTPDARSGLMLFGMGR